MPLSLRRNFSWTLIGNLCYAGCQWAMLIALAKLGSTAQVGQFALGLAIAAPLSLFANLHLRTLQATDAKHEYSFREYFSLRVVTSVLALLATAIVALLAGYSRETVLVICAAGFAKSIESISDVIYGLMQQQERMDRVAQSLMLRGPIALVLFVLSLFLTHSVVVATFTMGAAWLIVLLTFDSRSSIHAWNSESTTGPGVIAWRRLATLARIALPLGFVSMLVSLNGNIPRYFIEHYAGQRSLGIYAAMAYLLIAGTTVVNALGQSVSSRLAQLHAGGMPRRFIGLLLRLFAFATLLGLIGVGIAILAGRPLLALLYSPEYSTHTLAFQWLMVASGLSYLASFAWYGITAARAIRVQLPLFGMVALCALVSSWWLVPRYGITGASMALALTAFVQVAMTCTVLASVLGVWKHVSGVAWHRSPMSR